MDGGIFFKYYYFQRKTLKDDKSAGGNCLDNIVVVEFDNPEYGKERIKQFPELQKKYNGKMACPIEKIEFSYSLSKRETSHSFTTKVIQFPLCLGEFIIIILLCHITKLIIVFVYFRSLNHRAQISRDDSTGSSSFGDGP